MPTRSNLENGNRLYQDIISKASVRAVMEFYGLKIENSGKGWKTICPFHDDHDPSLSIRNDDKVWHCFVCNESGNAISFVEKYERKVLNNKSFTRLDAMKKTAEICHLEMDLSGIEQSAMQQKFIHNGHVYTEQEKHLLTVIQRIQQIAVYNLNLSENKEALEYLRQRGMNDELIKASGFGYVSSEQVNKIINSDSISNAELAETGFLRYDEQNGTYTPTYRNRILIPIYDENGNTVSFAGRSINGEEPKYLLGRTTSLFSKSNHLYNYHNARNSAYEDKIYIVEGFMDVAGGNKIGIQNIVASMGTALTQEQLKMIQKLNCEVVLMWDNDDAGKAAMIRELPELIRKGFRVSVVPLDKVEQQLPLNDSRKYKDLWDFADSGIKEENLGRVQLSGLRYLLEYKYLAGRQINTETIYQAYAEARKDNILISSKDEIAFEEYIESISDYTRNEIEKIIHDKPIQVKQEPLSEFKDNLLKRYFISSLDSYIDRTADNVKREYYLKNRTQIISSAYSVFNAEPEKFFDNNFVKINMSEVAEQYFSKDEEWHRYETINKFQFENIFDRTFIKNAKGEQAELTLNIEQKQMIINQFNESVSEQERLNLKHIEELYIFDRTDAIRKIIGLEEFNSPQIEMLTESMARLSVAQGKGAYIFDYGSVFDKKMFVALDAKYKTDDGSGFKKILLFDNQGSKLDLKKENIKTGKTKETPQQEQKQAENITTQKEITKSIRFTVYKSLVIDERNDYFFVRIPNTQAKKYMYLNKNNCRWSDNKAILIVELPADKKYQIYSGSREKMEIWDSEQMLKKWESKKGNQKQHEKKKNGNELKESKTVHNEDSSKLKLPSLENAKVKKFTAYTLPKERIIGESPDYYNIRSYESDYELSVPKSDVVFNRMRTEFSIYPKISQKKGVYSNETLSDIHFGVNRPNGFQLLGRMPFNVIDKHLGEKGAEKQIFSIMEEHQIKIQDNGFVRLPVYKDGIYGYIRIANTDLSRVDEHRIALMSTPYHEYNCFKANGESMDTVFAKNIHDYYMESRKEHLDIENYEMNKTEKEVDKE